MNKRIKNAEKIRGRVFTSCLFAVMLKAFLLLAATPLHAQDSGQHAIDVGVAWQGKSKMPERVLAGMQTTLAEYAPGIRLEIRKELADAAGLKKAIADFERNKKAMVILRSNGAAMLGQRGAAIPAFIGAANNPVELGAAFAMDKPKPNITGVTYHIPARIKLETFKQVYPAIKNYVLLVEDGHPSSPIDAEETTAASPGLGLTGKTVFCKTVGDALGAIKNADENDSIIIGSQALLMDRTEKLVEAAGSRPVFAYSERPVEAGALAGMVADDNKLGQMLGRMLIDVLINGKPVGEIPIQEDPEPRLRLNHTAIEQFRSKIPFAIQSLAKTEQMLDTIFKNAPTGIGVVENRVIAQVNDYILDLTGYTRAELIGQKTRILYPTSEEYDDVGRHAYSHATKEGSVSVETRWLNKNDEIRDVSVALAPLDPNNISFGHTISVLDITDRKEAEAALASRTRWFLIGFGVFVFALLVVVTRLVVSLQQHRITQQGLRESEERFRFLVDYSHDLIWMLKSDGVFSYVSPSWKAVLGYEPAYMIEKSFQPFVHPDDVTACQNYMASILDARKSMPGPQYRVKNVYGNWRWHEGSITPVFGGDGALMYFVGVSRDITDRKKIEEALKASEEKYRSILEKVEDGYFEVDLDGNFTFFNDSMCQILGYSSTELMGMNYRAYLDTKNADKVYDAYNQVFASDKPLKAFDWELTKKDGEKRYVDTSVSLRKNANGETIGFRGIARDITERKKAQSDRNTLQAQLNQAQKMESVGRLAGGVAHDFNNMLTIINGYAEMMAASLSPSDPMYKRVKEIHNAGERSAVIVRKLLAFARKQTIAPVPMNLNDSVSGMLKMLQRLIGENIDLLWKPADNIWLIKMDYSQVDQILANLLVNARDAIIGVGKITIESQNVEFDDEYCEVHAGFTPGQYVMLAVSDNGCGMEQHVQENLFEPFFTTKGADQGTGLGLSIVYGIIKQNKGFINVYSEVEKGTSVKMYLPRLLETPGVVAREKNKKPLSKGRGETILVLEDESTVLDITRTMLENLGYTLLAANTPNSAIALAEAHDGKIDLLITDIVMPEMNGREFADRLKSLYPDIKVLFMSGYTADVIAHHTILEDGMYFIEKPFSIGKLAAKVRELLSSI